MSGRLGAGEPLREEQLSATLGVSRTPLREAVARLRAEGIVVGEGKRGVSVFKPSVDDLREIYAIRMALEALAARRAAELAGPDDIARLESIYEALEHTERGHRWVRRNRDFHLTYYAIAGWDRLLKYIRDLRIQSEPYVWMLVAYGHSAQAQAGHRELIEAARRSDGDAADDALRRHLNHTVEKVLSELDERNLS